MAEFVEHQGDARDGGEQHAALLEITLEEFVLDVGVHSEMGGLGDGTGGAVGVGKTGEESEIARAFVFGALLRLDVEMNAVEVGVRMRLDIRVSIGISWHTTGARAFQPAATCER